MPAARTMSMKARSCTGIGVRAELNEIGIDAYRRCPIRPLQPPVRGALTNLLLNPPPCPL